MLRQMNNKSHPNLIRDLGKWNWIRKAMAWLYKSTTITMLLPDYLLRGKKVKRKRAYVQYLPSPNAFSPESPLNPSKCSEIIPAPFFPKEMKERARIFHIMMPSSGAAFSFLVFVSKSLKFNFLFRISIPPCSLLGH